MISRAIFCLLLGTAVLLAGCAPVLKKPVLPEVTLNPSATANLSQKLSGFSSVRKYLRALYRVNVHDGSEVSTVRQAIVTKPPERFRLETLPLNGFYTLNLLTIADGKAVFVDKANKRTVSSADIDQLIQKELGLSVPGTFLGYLFMGRVPPAFLNNYAWLAYQLDVDTVVLTDRAHTIYWYLSPNSLNVKKVQFWDQFSEELKLEIVYTRFAEFDNLSLPTEMLLKVPRADFAMEFSVQSLKLSDQVAANLFSVSAR